MKGVVAEDESLLRQELVSLLTVAWPGLEIVACDTLKVRATSACASPLARRWSASCR